MRNAKGRVSFGLVVFGILVGKDVVAGVMIAAAVSVLGSIFFIASGDLGRRIWAFNAVIAITLVLTD